MNIENIELRDYFAGQALQGILSVVRDERTFDWNDFDRMAVDSYRCADAFLKEREKEKNRRRF